MPDPIKFSDAYFQGKAGDQSDSLDEFNIAAFAKDEADDHGVIPGRRIARDFRQNQLKSLTDISSEIKDVPASATGFLLIAGGANSTSGWKRTSAITIGSMYVCDMTKDYTYSGVIDASAVGSVCAVQYYNESATLLGYEVISAGTYSDKPLNPPDGTTRIAACSYGVDAVIKEVISNFDTDKLADVGVDIDQISKISKIEGLFNINDVYYNFDSSNNSEIDFASPKTISSAGDYVELIIRQKARTTFLDQYIIGSTGSNQNTFGFYYDGSTFDGFRIRANTGNYVSLDGGSVDWRADFHKVKVLINGSSQWELYIDDVLADTQAVDGSGTFIINNFCNAGASSLFASVDIKQIVIKSQGVTSTYTDLTTNTDFSAVNNVTKVVDSELAGDVYYSVDADGSPSGNELVTVYTRIKGSFFQAAKIAHMVNATGSEVSGVAPYSDLWRLYGIYEAKLVGSDFVEAKLKYLHTSESEYVYNDIGASEPDFTGGYHGYEVLIRNIFLVDGLPVDLESGDISLTRCKTFEYQQYSNMYEQNNYPTVKALHYKSTSFNKPGYKTINKLWIQSAFTSGRFFAGLSCVGSDIADRAYVDDLDIITAVEDNSITSYKTGGDSTVWFFQNAGGFSAKCKADFTRVIDGSGNDVTSSWNEGNETLLYDRSTDMKYYRYDDHAADSGSYVEAVLELRIRKI